jgi:hypothetical protein
MQDEYIEPEQLLKIVNSEMEIIPNEELFNKPEHKKLREKWGAAQFGIGYGKYVRKCSVRPNELKDDGGVDFSLKANDQEWEFQFTERLAPDRQRGKEYKIMAKDEEKTLPTGIGGKIESIEWIKQAIEKKADKHYANSAKLNLLIYENFSYSPIEYNGLKLMAKEYIGKFASVWILSNSRICSLFSSPELGEVPGWKNCR